DDDLLTNYMQMGRSLVFVMFAHLLTADAVYEGYKSRFLTIASWPIGGYASPEGAGSVQKWPSHLTEYLGLFYDWCYDVLSENERAVVKGSLEWRINYTMHSFAWETDDGTTMRPGSISVRCKSHAFENLMVTIPGALAICDESELAREALEIGLHYVMGMTSGMGEDEGWNEGPGYGNGKMKWLMDATWYLQTAMPDLDFGVNDMYDAYCDFFARITPIGAKHISFGNRGFNESDWASSRITTFRRVAMLCQNGQAIQNWGDTRRRLQDLGMAEPMPFSPWIDYALPFYAGTPEPELDAKNARLFSIEGWVMASSASPSDYEAQKNAVSMTFACRPRGGYSHAFRSENAFDIHAYGETLAVGGGTTSNQSHFANHTMSHNTVLINGREQEAAKDEFVPFCGRIVAFEQGDGFVYWAGDATAAYGEATGMGRFVRHVVFVEGSYFVIFDDLAVVEGHDPTTFQWLYHVTPEVPLNFDADKFSVRYAVGQTHVVMQHVGDVADLTFQNLKGADGMVNPITGENLCQLDKWLTGKEWKRQIKKIPTPIEAHHLWISHGTPQREMQFLTVIAPFRNGETAPEIEGLSDRAVRVTFRERERVIAFDGRDDADISVDCSGIINNATEAISER
ncbi:MAG: heparinase II/III family protein, partial [Candidatus Latescibacteria bacterium]|nr:heparinase II/III family protein [Candidatus Latescibacterota bacterium]